MQEIITTTRINTKITNTEVLGTLLNVLVREGYTFNSTKEIQTAIKNKFKANVSIELIDELFYAGRMYDEKVLQYRNYYL